MASLDSCHQDKPVVYVGFGSQITMTKQQMKVVASALEDSGVRFIWAVKDPMKKVEDGDDDRSIIPNGFEDWVAGKGLVIKGWAPQVEILRHWAVDEYGVAIRLCKGLRSIPDAIELTRIFVNSTTLTRPERVRAMELKKTALKAIRKGGSSYQALDKLVEELSSFDCNKIVYVAFGNCYWLDLIQRFFIGKCP
ncbi:hypothetical protein CRYUN_Cryun29cG0016800 [Craigia yunnanensis]